MSEAPERAHVLFQQIKSVLLFEWDPIGVQAIPEAQDEYDGYVPTLLSMLITGKEMCEISNYLLWLETERMGLTADRQRAHTTAGRLLGLLTLR